jgi:hypothetical protein
VKAVKAAEERGDPAGVGPPELLVEILRIDGEGGAVSRVHLRSVSCAAAADRGAGTVVSAGPLQAEQPPEGHEDPPSDHHGLAARKGRT